MGVLRAAVRTTIQRRLFFMERQNGSQMGGNVSHARLAAIEKRDRADSVAVSGSIARPECVLKMSFDRVAAAIGLILLAPLFLLVAAMIYWKDPGPILFAHRRIGKDGKLFACWKFRTMAVNGDTILKHHLANDPEAAREWRETQKLKHDPRVSAFGQVLRKSSIDELPQLINILRGEMSLVGPRPIVHAELHHYGPVIVDYLSVRPGLTGLWQISGRSDVGYGERVSLDKHYAENRSFLGDLHIIARTVSVVLLQKGSY
jgi:exopolysaccharide production protein ExoY